MLYSVHAASIVVNRTGGYNLENTLVGQLWLIISGHVTESFIFTSLVPRPTPFSVAPRTYCKQWKAGQGLGTRLQFHYSAAYSAPVEYKNQE